MTLAELTGALRALAEGPFEEARAAPPGIYRSPQFLELEQRHIFAKEWICAGRAETLAKAGDYLTMEIAGQPVLVVKGRDGTIRAFSNVCLHRMSVLLEGRGRRRTISCPYHAWSYGLDGRLLAAPHMEKSPAFRRRDYRLPQLRCELWEGWIYVSLDPDIEPVAQRLRAVKEAVTGRYRFEEYREAWREERVWNANWKILAENFMESYHLFRLHRATVGPQSRVDEMRMPAGGAAFNHHWITKESDFTLANAHPDCGYLEGEWRRTTALITIYPSHMITLTPGYFWYLALQPDGCERVRILYGGGMAPDFAADARGAEHIGAARALLDAVNEEDRVGVEAVMRGMKARLARPGHLSHLERPNFEFWQYIARRVAGSGAGPGGAGW